MPPKDNKKSKAGGPGARPKKVVPVASAVVRIPEIDLSRGDVKPSAEALRRIPELELGTPQTRRGWTGPPLPFTTIDDALAWGMRDLVLGKASGLALDSQGRKLRRSKQRVADLRRDLNVAVNKDPAVKRGIPQRRAAGGRFAKKGPVLLAVPPSSGEST